MRTSLIPVWIRLVPFFMSALFFLSVLFAIFSPMPILMAHFRYGRRWAWLAAVTNGALVYLGSDPASFALYVVFVLTLALLLPELLRRRMKLEGSAFVGWLSVAAAGIVLVLAYSQFRQVDPILLMKSEVSALVDQVSQTLPQDSMTDPEREAWRGQVMTEFPAILGIFSLIMIWANLTILLSANPAGIRDRLGLPAGFIRSWRAPDPLLWLTILAGGAMVMNLYSPIGSAGAALAANFFKLFMAIYAIQGLSVLAFAFDAWNVRGFLRVFGMMFAVFFMLPLLLSIGFFDHLFDFRAKFRQS